MCFGEKWKCVSGKNENMFRGKNRSNHPRLNSNAQHGNQSVKMTLNKIRQPTSAATQLSREKSMLLNEQNLILHSNMSQELLRMNNHFVCSWCSFALHQNCLHRGRAEMVQSVHNFIHRQMAAFFVSSDVYFRRGCYTLFMLMSFPLPKTLLTFV